VRHPVAPAWIGILAALVIPGPSSPAQEPLPAPPIESTTPGAGAAPALTSGASEQAAMAEGAIAAYNASDYAIAATLAARYIDRAREQGRIGREVAEVLFVLGHSRYEIQRQSAAPHAGDYRADIVAPLEESLRVVQDNAAFKTLVLANAYYDLWKAQGERDAEAEGRAHWYLLRSIVIRESEARNTPPDSPEHERLARFQLLYLDRCLELARRSATPELYLYRIRAAAPRGFASPYADRFRQVFELTYFDKGNMRAAALYQFALDSAQDRGLGVDEVVVRFQEAVEACRSDGSRAEVNRQTADYLAVIDLPERRAQAADFAHRAYDLNPGDAEIRRQYGSALHLLSFGAYARGQFEEATRLARQALDFDWQGVEMAHLDLSRSAAELGRAEEAIQHGEEAYRRARLTAAGPALQPFAQNLVNVLRQFGQEGRAASVASESSSSGVF